MKIYFSDDPVKQKMLEALVKIYNTIENTQHENYWRPIKDVIESAIGKSIEEVIND